MKILYTLIVGVLISIQISAQEKYANRWYDEYKNAELKNSGLSSSDTSIAGITIFDRTAIDYVYEDIEGTNRLVEYVTYHFKYNLNSEKAIEDYNKLYVNLNSAIDLDDLKVRVIKKDNKVVVSEKSEIKEAENFEEYGRYKYLAVNGMEIGADLEYIYTIKKYPYLNGKQYLLQNTQTQNNVEFVLQCPTNLIFDFKSLNGFPEMVQDTTDTLVNRHRIFVETLPKVNDDEPYSNYDAARQGIIYKIGSNTATGKTNLVSYGELAVDVYETIHDGVDNGSIKALKSISGKLKLNKLDQEEQLRTLEDYIKTNFNVVEKSTPELADIATILKNKVVSNIGITRLFVAWTEYLGINYQLALSIDRTEYAFDPNFEAYNWLGMYYIYYPDIDKYIMPRIWNYRIGPLMTNWSHSYGIFLFPEKLGEWNTYVAETRFVPTEDQKFTYTNHDIAIDLGSDFEKSELTVTRTSGGHEAVIFQTGFKDLQGEVRENVEKILTEYIDDGEEVISSEFINGENSAVFVKPFIVKTKLNYPNLINQAGSKYLVNIGKVIGPQSELYNEETRTLDIEAAYNHSYERKISVKIPDGYKVQNLEKLKIHEELVQNDEVVMLFDSRYELKGNTLSITVIEYYDQIHTSKEYYNDFKAIINAAANFNKAVLIFEK